MPQPLIHACYPLGGWDLEEAYARIECHIRHDIFFEEAGVTQQ